MSRFDDQEEVLYLFEIAVENIELTPDKIHESGNKPFLVKIKFLSLPIFTLLQNNCKADSTTTNKNNNDDKKNSNKGKIDFSSGKSCLFAKRPRDLVNEMKIAPLTIGVFCIGDTYPIVKTILPFTGCLCDQIAMAMNDFDHMPKPYVLRGSYGLLDAGGNPSGNVNLVVTISCQGKYVTTHYQIKENSFVFKNDREEGQYSVQRVVPLAQGIEQEQKVDTGISEIHREPSETTEEGKKSRRSSKKTKNNDKKKGKKKKAKN